MPVTLVRYSENLRNSWNAFVTEQAVSGTFLHLREFYDHNPANAADDHSLLFYQDKKLTAVFPCTEVQGKEGVSLHSHLRSTYGGLLVPRFMGLAEAEQVVSSLMAYAKEKKIREIFIRTPFRFLSESSPDVMDFLLTRAGFQVDYRDLEFAIATQDLGDSLDSVKGLNGKTRNQIRKALSSDLKILKSEKWAEFWTILESNLRDRYQTKPVHDLPAIQTLLKKVGSDRVTLWSAEFEGKVCAGIVVFNVNPRVCHFQYVASDPAHKEKCPINGLYWQILEDAKRRGVAVVNFGSATTNKGADINHGLVHFKEGFGAEGHLREQMVYRSGR